MLFADTDGAMFDFLNRVVTYVIGPLVVGLTGVVGFLIKWNMRQSDQLNSNSQKIKDLEQSKADLEKTAETLATKAKELETEKGQLTQKVQELQSSIKLHEKACGGTP